MEKRYIDAEDVKLSIRRFLMPNVDFDGTVRVEDAERYFLKLLDDTPLADVREVKHGEWIIVEYEYLTCKECGHYHYTGCESTAEAKEKLKNGEVPNFCPNCGAAMRKEE